MTEHESERFISDTVDEQIDASLAGNYTAQPLASLDPLDMHVVQALQHYYAPVPGQPPPLARVWNRLAQQQASQQAIRGEEATNNRLRQNYTLQSMRGNSMKTTFSESRPQNTFLRRLTLFAAIVFIALLVGSTLAVFHLARQQASIQDHPMGKHPAAPVHTDEIYAVVGDAIYRYDATTHKQLWSFPMQLPSNAENISSQGQVVNGVLYTLGTGSDGYYSYAINTSNGSLRWRFKVQYQTPDINLVGGDQLIANGTVYLSEASSAKGYTVLTALDAATGRIRWQHRYNGTGIATRLHFVDASAGITLEAATNDVLYGTTFTGTGTTTLFAIGTKNGSMLWQKRVSTAGGQPDLFSGLVVDGVLCISGSRHLYGFDARTGDLKWSVALDGQTYQLTASNGVVYLGTTVYKTASDNSVYIAGGSLYAVRAKDGALLWRYTTQAGVSSPAVQNGMVFVSVSRQDAHKQQSIIAFDANNGKIRWTHSVPYDTTVNFNPQLVASKAFLYVGTSGTQVQVLRLSDGNPVNTFALPVPDPASPSSVVAMTIVSLG